MEWLSCPYCSADGFRNSESVWRHIYAIHADRLPQGNPEPISLSEDR